MNNYIKLISIIAIALVVTGCASSGKQAKSSDQKSVSPLINFEPAIDISYSEVTKNVQENIGVDVRWGGQIISTEIVDDTTTRLTVFAHPLTSNGRPLNLGQSNQDGGRFVVELKDGLAQDVVFDGHFVTFYGTVTDKVVLANGNKQKTIPVVSVVELVDWDIVDREYYANNRRGNAFYSLGYKTGHFYSPSFYGFSRFSRFGSHSRFSRFGFNSRFGRGFSRGFKGSSFRSHRGFGRRGCGRRGFSRF